MATKHMNAAAGDFADTVLMPGDPLRAKYIAERFLGDSKLVTNVRNMLGFTGMHNGRAISVMAHGMGIPSVSIYATELMQEFGVKRIIRVGSCGTVHASTHLRDIIIAMGACTDSGVNRQRFGGYDYAPIADFNLLRNAVDAAESKNVRYQVGNIFSADLFYTVDTTMFDTMEKYNILGLEMEAAGLYALAAEYNVEALAICTVSDNIRTGAALTADERASTFDDMIEIALDTVHRSD
ncbi:MAG: purine-nucleoside phosphorylase [Gammaproteobacteria bacterium]|nr:purine-nucleoside phosphorylase [Gammaproteobacteria bacterium]MBT8143920.1 purine-nucleoside phosphorylase [Gammaproteobacteria bacterium]NND61167.1 purine-nucleoside phosphorylase [Gammaproteobacteria bacterium]